MNNLIVLVYDGLRKAEEVRLMLLNLEREDLKDVDDAVVAIRYPDGEIKLNQSVGLNGAGAKTNGFSTRLFGLIFQSPPLAATSYASDAFCSALMEVGINNQFLADVAEFLKPGKSALFVLLKTTEPDKLLKDVEEHGAKILHTSVNDENEQRMTETLQTKFLAALPSHDKPASYAANEVSETKSQMEQLIRGQMRGLNPFTTTKETLTIVGSFAALIIIQVAMNVLLVGVCHCGALHQLHQICWGKVIGNSVFSGISVWIVNRYFLKLYKWFPVFWIVGVFFSDLNWEGGAAFAIH